MNRRAFLVSACAVSTAGCVTVSFGGGNGGEVTGEGDVDIEPSDEGEQPGDHGSVNGSEAGPDPSEVPIIHELDLDYDDRWLMMHRRYEVPKVSDEFEITERWHITDSGGATVLDEDRTETIESDRNLDSLLVSGGTWYIGRWDNNIQAGEYTVELIIVGANGAESSPTAKSITVDSDPTE